MNKPDHRLKKILGCLIGMFLIACPCFFTSGCGRQKAVDSITIAGSTTVLTIAQASAEEFMKEFPRYRVFVQGGGSSVGIEAAGTGAAQIGMTSRELKGEELKSSLRVIPVAYDAIAVIVNPSNKIKNISEDQLREIYTGKIKNWKDLGGADMEIVLVNRDEASGTREAFGKKILGKAEFTKDAVIQPGNGQVRSIISSAKASIGYLSLGYVDKSVKVVAVDNVIPTIGNVRKGVYPLHRKLYFLTKGKQNALTQRFIDFVLGEKVQKDIVSVEFVPVRHK